MKTSWFVTRAGRLVASGIFISVGCGYSTFQYLSHTYLLNEVKEVFQMYRNGVSVGVTPEVMRRFNSVLNDLHLPIDERRKIKPFTCFGFGMFYSGSTWTSHGALVGLPYNFNFHSTSEINVDEINNFDKEMNWTNEEEKAFKNSLIFSERAQKYLIASQVMSVKTPYVYYHSSYPALCTVISYVMARTMNRNLKLLQRPILLRGSMYVIVGLFGYGLWAFLHDYTSVKYQLWVDEVISECGDDYLAGAVEAYTKLLDRNKAMRSLLGDKGIALISALGNENTFFRRRNVPLVARRDFFLKKMAKNKSEENDSITDKIKP